MPTQGLFKIVVIISSPIKYKYPKNLILNRSAIAIITYINPCIVTKK